MAKNIETTILSNIINDEKYCRKVLPHVKAKYFSGEYSPVYDIFLKFVSKYNKIPNSATLELEFKQSNYANLENRNEVLRLIKNLNKKVDVEEEWLLDKTEAWCKDQAINLAIIESVNIIDGSSKGKDRGAIPELLQNALAVTFDNNIGHDYIESAESRYEFYHRTEEKLGFDLEMFNKITNNGVSKKTLNMLLASTGVGKSLIMCHFAAYYLMQSKNVLYVTCEMAEERIAERIDANLMDVDIQDVSYLDSKKYASKIKKLQNGTNGKLIIKEYPTSVAHVDHLRALLTDLKLKKSFVPDVIFIDYLNIMASSRMKSIGGSIGSYNYIKSIAEEIRGLAVEQNVPIWSATQTNREGANNSDVEITNTSESFGLPATVDLYLAAIRTEQLDKMNQMMFKQLKNRYNDLTENRRFVVGIDRAKMKLYDADDSPSDNSGGGDSSRASSKSEDDYSGFKY